MIRHILTLIITFPSRQSWLRRKNVCPPNRSEMQITGFFIGEVTA